MPFNAQAELARVAKNVERAKDRKARARAGTGAIVEAVEELDLWEWKFADALLKAHPVAESGSARNDGSHSALAETAATLEARVGVTYSVGHLRQVRATAAAWPHEERSPCASFTVHQRLRGQKDRVGLLARLERQSKTGHVSESQVQTVIAKRIGPKSASGGSDSTRRSLARMMRTMKTPASQRAFVELVGDVAESMGWTVGVKALG
jgi:hypothetical protein